MTSSVRSYGLWIRPGKLVRVCWFLCARVVESSDNDGRVITVDRTSRRRPGPVVGEEKNKYVLLYYKEKTNNKYFNIISAVSSKRIYFGVQKYTHFFFFSYTKCFRSIFITIFASLFIA